jgi:Trypsin/PEP-CTERM motif
MKNRFKFLPLVAAALLAASAQAQSPVRLPGSVDPTTGNTSDPSNWRFAPGQVFNGVAGALDGVARLNGTVPEGSFRCSGNLLAGGLYVLTAAHCAEGLSAPMQVQFGWHGGTALETRTVALSDITLHPGWVLNASFGVNADTGADIAILKLNAPVTSIVGYTLSTTNDVGKEHLMAGYGSTQRANENFDTNFNDDDYGHYAWNKFDVTSKQFGLEVVEGAKAEDYRYGETYMVDFDRSSRANGQNWNVLGRIAADYGGTWTSDQGLGAREGLIAGGDSGGGDFVYDAANNRFLLSAVHSWGWNNPCGSLGYTECDAYADNPASFGDISGSTAVFSHLAWIQSVTTAPIPEPTTLALLLGGLGLVGQAARRRRV